MSADLKNWSVTLVEDSDGHLNVYVKNFESKEIYEVDGEQHGDELHYRITSKEIEELYHNSLK